MKKIFSILTLAFAVFTISSCSEDVMPTPVYDGGANLLHFQQLSGSVLAADGAYTDYNIDFGTISRLTSNAQVELVQIGGDAVEGVDYEVVGGSASVAAGNNNGVLTVRVFGDDLSCVPKSAIFGLKSSSVGNANYKQEFELAMGLYVDVTTFVGVFDTTLDFFTGNPHVNRNIVIGTDPNTIIIQGFIANGFNITVLYDPATGAVTVPKQATGYSSATYGPVSVEVDAPEDAEFPSSVNFCNRTMTLRTYYSVSAGYYDSDASTAGVQPFTDTFVGL